MTDHANIEQFMRDIEELEAPAKERPEISSMKILGSVAMTGADFMVPAKPIEFLDGMLIPRGVCTALMTPPGSGKTTAQMTSALAGAMGRGFSMFGGGDSRPVRSLLILGEDTRATLRSNLLHLPFEEGEITDSAAREAVVFAPLLDVEVDDGSPELFDVDGKVTERGADLVREIKRSGPWDFILFDTISSLSASEYLDRRSSYATTNALNSLASATGAAVVYNGHLTKAGGSGSLKAGCTSADVISLAAGSGGLVGAARNMVVLAPRGQSGLYDNVELDEGDEVFIGVCKSSINPDWNMRLFPVIRDARLRTLRAVDHDGTPLLSTEADREKLSQKSIKTFVMAAVEALSELRQPASASSNSKVALAALLTGALETDQTPRGTSVQYQRAIDALLKTGRIRVCTTSRTGTTGVYDLPTGDYADEGRYEEATGEKIPFVKGAPSLERFEALVLDILERDHGKRTAADPIPAPAIVREADARHEIIEEHIRQEETLDAAEDMQAEAQDFDDVPF